MELFVESIERKQSEALRRAMKFLDCCAAANAVAQQLKKTNDGLLALYPEFASKGGSHA